MAVATVVFSEDFDYDDDTLLSDHDWTDNNDGFTVSNYTVQSGKGNTLWSGFIFLDTAYALAERYEVFADFTRPTTTNKATGMDLALCINDAGDELVLIGAVSATLDSATLDIKGLHTDDFVSTTIASGISWAMGDEKRLGITVDSDLNFTVWIEPAGGGTRTELGTFEVPSTFFDGSHNKQGIQEEVNLQGPGIAGDGFSFDNFTIQQNPVGPCFETDYDCASATAATVTQATDPTAVTATQVVPDSRMVLGDGCIPDATLGAYS